MKEDGLFNCQAVLVRLREMDYDVSDDSQGLRTTYRNPRKQKATVLYETKPGEQAQID